ncbi:MAG: DHH family phosphoesterase [Defluviitaleaceae bacterium]|nr:DHH family phosphoesterase [Defluviitaleaceae bacterium]
MNEIELKLQKAIDAANSVVVAGHVNPDGDAIGACLAMAACLDKVGKDVVVLLEDYDSKYDVIPGRHYIYQGDYDALTPDLFISLDASTPDRLGKAADVMKRAKATALFDHHLNNSIEADIRIVDTSASSTAIMVYSYIDRRIVIDADIGAAIYAGLIYDTGGFRHRTTTPETLEVAAKLMRAGVQFSKVYSSILFEKSRDKTPLFARALSRVAYAEPEIAYTYITREDMEELRAVGYPDGVVDYMINTNGVNTAVYALQKEEGTEMSLRSRVVNVGELAAKLGGGGHKAAAGFTVKDAPPEAVEMIVKKLQAEQS